MREIELKSVVDDLSSRRRNVEAAGATLHFEGGMTDHTYVRDAGPEGERLRVRTYQSVRASWAELSWKGPARTDQGYKVREELTTRVSDAATVQAILERTGFTKQGCLMREIAWYLLRGATLRFERFPRMDVLVEVEGTPEAIEEAIRATGLNREAFTADPLTAFVARFESRTGLTAVLAEEKSRPSP
jgi:adenylate cyclase class IV